MARAVPAGVVPHGWLKQPDWSSWVPENYLMFPFLSPFFPPCSYPNTDIAFRTMKMVSQQEKTNIVIMLALCTTYTIWDFIIYTQSETGRHTLLRRVPRY